MFLPKIYLYEYLSTHSIPLEAYLIINLQYQLPAQKKTVFKETSDLHMS